MNLSTKSPLEFPQALSTVVDNDITKLSMIKNIGGFLPYFIFYVPCENKLGAILTPVPAITFFLGTLHLYVVLGAHIWK